MFGVLRSSLLVVEMNIDFSDAEGVPDTPTFVKISSLTVQIPYFLPLLVENLTLKLQ